MKFIRNTQSKSRSFKRKRLDIPVQLQLPLFHNACRTDDQSEYTADTYFFQPEWHAFFLKAVDRCSYALQKASTYTQEINILIL